MVPIGTVVSVVWAAKSSSVCRPPMPRNVSTNPRRWRGVKGVAAILGNGAQGLPSSG